MTSALNASAQHVCRELDSKAEQLRITVHRNSIGSTVVDCGVEVPGGLEAGRLLARICLADLAEIRLHPNPTSDFGLPLVGVYTDQPIAACMASQYAGWQITTDSYFAMGSGPMRALSRVEELFDRLTIDEKGDTAVGVLETRQIPDEAICQKIANSCKVNPDKLTVAVARTSSQAGNFQIVARSVETALHKMLELGFDPSRIASGHGFAPLPPVAANDLSGIGRTNDAILYGASVTIWVRGSDDDLATFVRRIPSCSSADFGKPFAAIFERYDRDFYKIDPHLFSPARITLVNLDSGRSFQAGVLREDILQESFTE